MHTERILIDSRKRNKSLYPNTNSFRINLSKTYDNVGKVNTIAAIIPTTDYIINSNNNTLSVEYLSTTYVCQLTQGTWSAATYATQLQTDLNTSGNWSPSAPAVTWTVTYNSNTNKYTIASTGATNLNFNTSNLLASKLGFSEDQTSSSTSHISNVTVQMFNTKYYNIEILELQRNNVEGAPYAFARIYNNVNPNELLEYYDYYYKNLEHIWQSDNLISGYLSIELKDENNNLVDLNNAEWCVEIKISKK